MHGHRNDFEHIHGVSFSLFGAIKAKPSIKGSDPVRGFTRINGYHNVLSLALQMVNAAFAWVNVPLI